MHRPSNKTFGLVQIEQIVLLLEGNKASLSTEQGTHEALPTVLVYPLGHSEHS
jgi:hypothetical protein